MQLNECIEKMKSLDNVKGHKLTWDEALKFAEPWIQEATAYGEEATPGLHSLITVDDTWSAVFALKALGEIKSKKSVTPLIEFIKNNEEEDYFDGCEYASAALIQIGKPAIDFLLKEVKTSFAKKKYYVFLVSALSAIKDVRVYDFMVGTLKDYIGEYKKYDGWFDIGLFVHGFEKQENKEVLPLLKDLLRMGHLAQHEQIEIKDAIEFIEYPENYEETHKITAKKMKEVKKFVEAFQRTENKGKFTDEEKKDFFERAGEADEEFEANFVCDDCHERQNIRTGHILSTEKGDDNKFLFSNEIRCKHCGSNRVNLTNEGKNEIFGKQLRILIGEDKGILPAGDKILVEEKRVKSFREGYEYLKKRLKEEPNNAELYLRAANAAKKQNEYGQAIVWYKKAIELNRHLIAAYINLTEIYAHRFEYYKIGESQKQAADYGRKLVELFKTRNYDSATIHRKETIAQYVGPIAEALDLNLTNKKIGRNDPCPCGSGKKYKKCCLNKKDNVTP